MKKTLSSFFAALIALSAAAAAPSSAAESDYLLHSTFEGDKEQWSGRGSASVKAVTGKSRSGEGSLYTSGREDSWNGASIALGSDFRASQDYVFSAYAMTEDTSSVNICLTLQYNDSEGTKYPKIAEAAAEKGQWVHLENSSFTIPEGASDIQLYIETEEGTCSFYIDEIAAAKAGTVIDEPSAPIQMHKGDINYDGTINSFDIILARKGLINGITDKRTLKAADADSNGVFELNDALLIMQFVAGKIKEFPVVEPVVVPGQIKYTTEELTEKIQGELVNQEPNFSHMERSGVQYGTIKKESYYSTTCKRNKPYVILLPADYDESKQYPVLYVMHGYYEDENRMITTGNGQMYTRQIIGNAIADGEAKDMIVVFPYIYSSATQDKVSGMDDANNRAYDNFINDLRTDLMPHIEEKYSIKTGRDNTAITGFSMGGREALLIGMECPDMFGYIGAICPAPGVMGSFSFDSENMPHLLMITGGSNDTVVYDNPKTYHDNFTKNGIPHVWHYIQGGAHGDNSIHPHLYNFVRGVFQATD